MTAPFAIAEVIGTISFAVSGYLVGSRKKLDLLGIVIVSMLTAFGGGLVRDVICGRIPNALRSPAPILLASGAVVLAVLLRLNQRGEIERSRFFVLADGIGLVAFSISGAMRALEVGLGFFGVVLLGFLTAVGGGIVRDTLVNEVPVLLRSEFYGTVAIMTATLVYLAHRLLHLHPAVLGAIFLFGLGLRLLAYVRHWQLPTL
jgi:uncharacterized membrane protein YeiH